MHNIAFEALYLPFISPNLAALLKGQSLEAGLILIYQQANEGSGPSQSAFLITASRRSAAPTLYVLYMILPRASIGGVLRLAAPLPVLTHWGPFGRQSVQ